MALKFNNNRTLYDELTKKEAAPAEENGYQVVEYPDYFTNNGNKKIACKNLGEKFASINSFFLDYLKEYHIPASFVKSQNKTTLRFLKTERFPFTIKVLNVADKKTSKIFNIKENDPLNLPVFEIHYNNAKDSLITESHLIAFNLCSVDDIKLMNRICSKINAVLKSYFERRNSVLAEANCCFGKTEDRIYLVDDFTPKSLKVIPANKDDKWVNPFKFETSNEIKKYTDHLFNLTNA